MIEWITINYNAETIPDENREVVAMSPEGAAHITQWRPSYNILCCQGKGEDSHGWRWAYLD